MAAVPLATSMLVVTFGRCVLAAVWVLSGRIDVQPQQHSRLRMLTVLVQKSWYDTWYKGAFDFRACSLYEHTYNMLLVLVLANELRNDV